MTANNIVEVEKLYAGYKRPYGIINMFRTAFDTVKSLFSDNSNSMVVKGLDFSFSKGRVVGFLGANGAGKTTTMKSMVKLISQSSGSVRFFDHDMSSFCSEVHQKTGSLIGAPDLYPYMTGKQNLGAVFDLYTKKKTSEQREKRIQELLDKTGLLEAENKLFSSYSTGMKQRLSIAASLIHSPKLLLLDEPTSGLDPRGQADVRNIVKELAQKDDVTVFISSHLLHEIEQLCDYVIIIDEGKLVVMGEVANLLSQEIDQLDIECSEPEKVLKIVKQEMCNSETLKKGLVKQAELSGSLITVKVKKNKGPELLNYLISKGCSISGFIPKKLSLEEFFLKKLSEGQGENNA